MTSPITTHVLDTSQGVPAQGLAAKLEFQENGEWVFLAQGETDDDGRIGDLLSPDARLKAGMYRMIFQTGAYFEKRQIEHFHPIVQITFLLEDVDQHYHIPLLLSPFGYTTYRGS